LFSWFGALSALGAAFGQEPKPTAGSPVPEGSEVIANSQAKLEEMVAKVSWLTKSGDRKSACEACKAALAVADLEHAPLEKLAAMSETLLRLGSLAYQAGDLGTAHDSLRAVLTYREGVLPDEHPELQRVRNNLAIVKRMLGDPRGALGLQKKALAVFEKTLSDEHPELQAARANLAGTMSMMGDYRGALELEEKVLAIFSRTVDDDHADLQRARNNLALTKRKLGDFEGALVLQEKVLEVRSRELPNEHVDLQGARSNLAATKAKLGDLPGALVLQESVLTVLTKAMLDEHPHLQSARSDLARTRRRLGDLRGALVLQEKVLEVLSRKLPDDHVDLQRARADVAISKADLGDLPAALALLEKAVAVSSEALPDDDRNLQAMRGNLACIKVQIGDLPGALALFEQVAAVSSRTLRDDHPDRQAALANLAGIKARLGDLAGAMKLEEQVLAIRSKTLFDDHPDLQLARSALASTKFELGDLAGALALQEKVLAARSRVLPDWHPDLQTVRLSLAATRRRMGDLPAAAHLLHSAVAGASARLAKSPVSTRDVTQLAVAAAQPLSYVGSILDASATIGHAPALSPRLRAMLLADSLGLLTMTRAAESRSVELLRSVLAKDPDGTADLRRAIDKANRDLEGALDLAPEGRWGANGKQVSRDDAIREAVLARDAAERALIEKVPVELRATPPASALAAALAADEAAIAYLTYTRWSTDREKPWITTSEDRIAAFVLTPAGDVTWHSLAKVADIESLIVAVRNHADAPLRVGAHSTRAAAETPPGRDPAESNTQPGPLPSRLAAYRDLLLEPVLAALPDNTRRLVVAPADEMLLAPIDDVPLDNGRTFGEAFDVRIVPSLCELMRRSSDRTAEPRALIVGDIDYDQRTAKPAPFVPGDATPRLAPGILPRDLDSTVGHPTGAGDTPTARRFTALPGTAVESDHIAQLFVATFPSKAPTVLRGAHGSETNFVEQAPGKTHIHVATHGYFAPESVWQAVSAHGESTLARFDVGREDRVGQLSPFALTGIAMAGANLPPNDLGLREGLLTASEIARLDLAACHLATLSACNTTLGVRRGGTGLASLRQAFHAAGAELVLASLWEVNDAEAQKLMTDFYARLWEDREEPRRALRAAKRAARERGVAFRDWAGWMITGR